VGLLLIACSSAPSVAAATSRVSSSAVSDTVNVWVGPSGKDSSCRRAAASKPCASLIRAYQIARCGDIVSIAAGTYPSQVLGHARSGQNTDAKDCSGRRNPVVFRGQSQRTVSIDGVWIGEPWVTLGNVTTSGLAVSGWDSSVGCYRNPVAHVTLSNSVIDARGAQANPLWMANVQHVSLLNNSIGNVVTGQTEISNGAGPPCPHNDHLTFKGNSWHDFLNPNGARDHMECLQFDAFVGGTSNDNVILQGNRFVNCGQYDVFISGRMNSWRIQNNFFDAPCSKQVGTGCAVAGGAISFSQDYANVIGQFNVFAAGTFPQFSILPGNQSAGLWRYNINGTFPGTFHCGGQNKWTLSGNIDAGGAVCGADTNAVGKPRIAFLTASYDGRSLRAGYGVLSERPLRVRLTVYRGGRKLSTSLARASVGIYNSPVAFRWQNSTKKRPTRLCARVYDGSASVAASCTPVAS
jgi:hypothetical protein